MNKLSGPQRRLRITAVAFCLFPAHIAAAQNPDAARRIEDATALSQQATKAMGHAARYTAEGKDAMTLVLYDERLTPAGMLNFFSQQRGTATVIAQEGYNLYIATNGNQWWIAQPDFGGWRTPNGPFESREEAMRWWDGGRLINPVNGTPIFPDKKGQERGVATSRSAKNEGMAGDWIGHICPQRIPTDDPLVVHNLPIYAKIHLSSMGEGKAHIVFLGTYSEGYNVFKDHDVSAPADGTYQKGVTWSYGESRYVGDLIAFPELGVTLIWLRGDALVGEAAVVGRPTFARFKRSRNQDLMQYARSHPNVCADVQ